jgi:hypothetical protein
VVNAAVGSLNSHITTTFCQVSLTKILLEIRVTSILGKYIRYRKAMLLRWQVLRAAA